MKQNLSNIFWGMILILSGSLAFAQNQGFITDDQPIFWIFIFAGISVFSFVFYFLSGVQNWVILFPAGIFGALSILIALAVYQSDSPAITAPLFMGIGLPFVVAFSQNRSKNWWALIPAGILAFISVVVITVDRLGGEWIGSLLFFIISIIFGLIYSSRRTIWAALVSYIALTLGFMPLIATSSHPEYSGILLMFAIALPFFVVYTHAPEKNWWALIPAGFMSTTGLLAAIILFPGMPVTQMETRAPNTILFAGMALTFAYLGYRHHKTFGKALAALLGLAAIGNLFIGNLQAAWPVLLVIGGAYMLYSAARPRKLA